MIGLAMQINSQSSTLTIAVYVHRGLNETYQVRLLCVPWRHMKSQRMASRMLSTIYCS